VDELIRFRDYKVKGQGRSEIKWSDKHFLGIMSYELLVWISPN